MANMDSTIQTIREEKCKLVELLGMLKLLHFSTNLKSISPQLIEFIGLFHEIMRLLST
jgi:hypothetical protein